MLSDIIWMIWVLIVGFTEAFIRIFRKDIYLFIEEDEWKVEFFIRKKDKT